jgi:hypothetical protein
VNGGTLTLFNPWNGDQPNVLAGTETTTDLNGIAVAGPLLTPAVITSPATATDPSPVPLAFGSPLDGASDAAQKAGLSNDAEAPASGPAGAELQAATAWFASLGSDSALSGSGRAGVSHRPSSELSPALVDAVFHPAANNHEKLTGVGNEFPDALV